MFIERLYLQNFRNFAALNLSFPPGFIILVGPNGSGKSNLLESIYFGATLRRFPQSKLAQLFLEGQRYFKIDLEVAEPRQQHQVLYERSEAGYTRELRFNRQHVGRDQYLGRLPVISFLPQDLNLLISSPAGRRRYLDESLSLVSPDYRFLSIQYDKVVRARNEVLEKIWQGELGEASLSSWDERLAEFGGQITRWRGRFLDYLNLRITTLLKTLSPGLSGINFAYRKSGEPDKSRYVERLGALRDEEIRSAASQVGPHRDDFQTFLAGRPAVGFLSRGQVRMLTVSLKILERQYLEQYISRPPITLLDDVFSEFDEQHQRTVIDFLATLPQVFLTAAQMEDLHLRLPKGAKIYKVEAGTVNPL